MKNSKSAISSHSKLINRTALAAILFLTTALAAFPAHAQDSTEVRYVVQPGDTLSDISVRFDVSVDEIVQASNLNDPNNLHPGDVLVIPVTGWPNGTLVLQAMPLGESYLSLRRRYLLTDADMHKLNRYSSTSLDQIYLGFQVMLATERGELTNSARAAVGSGQSLLEIAAASGDNPWRLAAVNQLPGTWAAIPGDVLFTPARSEEGPGGLPSPITGIAVDDPGFVQGHTLVMRIAGSAELTLGGELIGKQLHFFSGDEGGLISLQGIPLEAEGETTIFSLTGTLANGANFSFSQPVRIESGNFSRASLSVDPQFLDEATIAEEGATVAEMLTPVTEEKMWSGLWGWPHDLVDEVTAGYGEFRTYNGGLAHGYHYGVDFGVNFARMNIYAPAKGRVIFAGPLVIRGNATFIDHGWGVYSAYYHQDEILVHEGDLVEPGQIIGYTGKTGRVSGPHLHWEVWVNGVPVQPLDWLARVFP
jgi:murein DD-endopeptidase MepM/ murein hydrolase activator NlpD